MNFFNSIIYKFTIPFCGRILVNRNKFVNVIYYHNIVRGEGESFMHINVNLFKKQMQYIYDHGYNTLRFDDLSEQNNLYFKKKTVLIAFDDGWLSNYTEIFDFMQSHDIKYNIFLTIGEICRNPEYLTWDIVRHMHESRLVGFGVHTYSHPDMSDLSNVDLTKEIELANSIFKNELGYISKDFCYPFGYYSEESNEYLSSKTNYSRIYTSSMFFSYCQNRCVIFGRNGISNDESFLVFKGKLKGYYNVWRSLFKW